MRTTSPIDPLLTKTVQGVLAATLMQPERQWTLSDLGRHLGRTPSSLQRTLSALVRSRILRRREEGTRITYQADVRCAYYRELRGLIVKTVGLVDVLRETLKPFQDRIRIAFVYGSIARAEEQSGSDVDLAVIGHVTLLDLSDALDEAEERIGRPVNVSSWSVEQFEKKLSERHHFVTEVVTGSKLMVIGSEDDLAKARGRRTRPTTRAAARRVRRDAKSHRKVPR